MKKIFLKILLIFTTVFLYSCNEEDCFTPPENIVFEFVNSSGENLIQNGTLDNSKIIVQHNEGNGNSTGINVKIGEDYKISLKDIGWNDGNKIYDVYLLTDPVKVFNFKVKSSRIKGKCSGYKIDDFEIENINVTKESGYYKIIVD